ncbi:hypothetical protein C2857_006928 [Epichloe festucae Fl1]|uniref:Antifungal protein n=1 Tax=Epichloe festucae (strain Fl1) TaxID=877507 RepID=A0A7S9KQB4_EPIFF|nr:hypothetical protein C2857_006928 [Epichloe festucae Fl1]
MKLTTTLALAIATLVVATPTPDEGLGISQRDNILEARKGCSGERKPEDKCTGKKLKIQNSFHNCKTKTKGKCCAKNSDGSEGLDVDKGQGREDCGYCFTGKCKA